MYYNIIKVIRNSYVNIEFYISSLMCPGLDHRHPELGAGPKKNSNWLKTAKSKWRHLSVYKIGF